MNNRLTFSVLQKVTENYPTQKITLIKLTINIFHPILIIRQTNCNIN